jgi:tRNA nucleotidyltransferase (CCA-adding enzyme)
VGEAFPVADIPAEVGRIARRLRENGYEAWYVGGAVRDVLAQRLLGLELARIGDFDIATSAPPERVRALFRRTVPVGIEHGTVAVLDERGRAHEVTTFRRDVKTDGRHAVVEFGVSLEEDLARRDFTINAIAVHPESGEMRDPFGGRSDIVSQRLRTVGDPDTRFREDWLRVLRGLRFASAYRLEVEAETWRALVKGVSELGFLSRERVRDEWVKLLTTSVPSVGVGMWRRAGALRQVWPELDALTEDHLAVLDRVTPVDALLLTAAALAWAGSTPEVAAAAAQRLRFSNKDVARIRGVAAALSGGPPDSGSLVAVRRWLSAHRPVAADAVAAALPEHARAELEGTVTAILAAGDPLSVGDLAITGDDLRQVGIPEGPAVGRILRTLLEEVLEHPERNRKELLMRRARELR